MTNRSNMIPIAGRLHCVAEGNIGMGANEIYDDAREVTQDMLNGAILEEKTYTLADYSGMGRVVLKKNMVEDVNTLTQDMFYKGEIGSRVPNTNTIFVIQYDYVLGEDITVPANCVLEFDGGSISGAYTLTGTNTAIEAGLVKIFGTEVSFAGTWKNSVIYPEWFGATNDGVDCSAAMNAVVAMLTSIGGGTIHFSAGSYKFDTLVITYRGYLCIEGEGKLSTFINNPNDDAVRIAIDQENSFRQANVYIHDLCIQGPGSTNPRGIGLKIESGEYNTGVTVAAHKYVISNVQFNGLNTGILLGNTNYFTFEDLLFVNYITGISGISGKFSNNSTFVSCIFSDGKSNAESKPIVSTGMGYSTFINCGFEGRNTIKCIDMRGGSGMDTFIGCRFEQLNNGVDNWLYVGNKQRYINCLFAPSANWGTDSPSGADETFLIYVEGNGNIFDDIEPETATSGKRTICTVGRNNIVKMKISVMPANLSLVGVWSDRGAYNIFESSIKESDRYINIINWINNNIQADTDAIFDSSVTTFAEYTSGNNNPLSAGVLGIGKSFVLTQKATALANVKWKIVDATASNYIYVFSCFVHVPTSKKIRIFFNNGTNDIVSYEQYLTTGRWNRVFITYMAKSSMPLYAGIESDECYIQYPQATEQDKLSAKVFPTEDILFSGTTNQGVNKQGKIYSTAAPTILSNQRAGTVIYNINYDGTNAFCWFCTASGRPGTWTARS